jgi:hypothetical protein
MMIPKYGKGFRLAVHLHKMLMLPTQLLVVILLISSALEAVNAADKPNPDFACTMTEPPKLKGLEYNMPHKVSLETFRWLVGCNKKALEASGSRPATYAQLQAYYMKKLHERFKAWDKYQKSPEGQEPPSMARKVPLCITTDQAEKDPRLKRFIPILKDLAKKEDAAKGKGPFFGQPKVW